MTTYIFHNETKSEASPERLSICKEDITNSYLISGAYFRAIIKDNCWDKSDVICAISYDSSPVLVYENGKIVECDDISHLESLEQTLGDVENYNLGDDSLIAVSCEEDNDCGCPSDLGDDIEVYSDIDDNEEDIEEEIWTLRRKMVGLKNMTKERIQEVRNEYFRLSGKTIDTHLRIELGMDIIKYLWKMVIREFTNIEHFKELRDEIFEFIENKLDKLDDYMRVEYENFREDILRVSSVEIKK
jgi:hypothetical protein